MPAKLKQIIINERPIRSAEMRPGNLPDVEVNTVSEIVLVFTVTKGSTHSEKRIRTGIPIWSKPITVSSHLFWLGNAIANHEKNGDLG